MKKLKQLLIVGLFALTSSVYAVSFGTASKDTAKTLVADGKEYLYIVGTASETGSYYKAGNVLTSGLKKAVSAPTDGSWQNMDLLSEGQINAGFVQADVYNLWLSKNPQFKDKLLASGTGRLEYIQLVMRKGTDEDSLQNDKAKVYVGLGASGGAGSWRNMCLLETNYAKASVITGTYSANSSIAINKLKSKEYDALVLTSYITPKSDFVVKIMRDSDIYFADVNDRDLNDTITVNGVKAPIYKFINAPVKEGIFSDTKVETIATEVLFVVNTDLMSTKQLSDVLDRLELIKSSLFK